MHTDGCGKSCRQRCHAKGSRKKLRMYRDTTNVEHEMKGYTVNNWSHRNSNKRFKDKYGRHTGKIFNRLTTKDSCTWNITHSTEITAV